MQADQKSTSSQSTGPLVELRGVDVTFDQHPVLRGINLAIPRGQTLAVIGESGCGKTVILKTIIGLIKPTRGTAVFDNQNLTQLNERELSQQRTRLFGLRLSRAASRLTA